MNEDDFDELVELRELLDAYDIQDTLDRVSDEAERRTLARRETMVIHLRDVTALLAASQLWVAVRK